MIHHISIAAEYPLHVAQVLAEIFQGQAIPFPEHPGSYIALMLDSHGTMIEVLPAGTELRPGTIAAPSQFVQSNLSPYTAAHAAVSVPATEAQIRAIAEREGWHVAHFERGDQFFAVIELWIENRQLIELLPAELAARYLTFMQPQNLKQTLAAAPESAVT